MIYLQNMSAINACIVVSPDTNDNQRLIPEFCFTDHYGGKLHRSSFFNTLKHERKLEYYINRNVSTFKLSSDNCPKRSAVPSG